MLLPSKHSAASRGRSYPVQVFIPISDEDLDRWPAGERLVPYRSGLGLLSQLAAQEPAGGAALSRGEVPTRPPDERPTRPPCRP
jgi:hypothetical protein